MEEIRATIGRTWEQVEAVQESQRNTQAILAEIYDEIGLKRPARLRLVQDDDLLLGQGRVASAARPLDQPLEFVG